MTLVLFPVMSSEPPAGSGVVSAWMVDDGDHVLADQMIAEVQVDKVAAEVGAPVSGCISILVGVDEEVRQGQPIASIT